jgi:hypothetical protein
MGAEGPREAAFLGCVAAVMDAGPGNELEAVREAVALAVERRWLGAAAAARAARLLAAGAALEAALLLVPPGWSVTIAVVDPRAGPGGDAEGVPERGHLEQAPPPPAPPGVTYVARSAPKGIRTDRMAVRFGPDDACHMPDHGFRTAALALCGEAMMLQWNLEGDGRMAPP